MLIGDRDARLILLSYLSKTFACGYITIEGLLDTSARTVSDVQLGLCQTRKGICRWRSCSPWMHAFSASVPFANQIFWWAAMRQIVVCEISLAWLCKAVGDRWIPGIYGLSFCAHCAPCACLTACRYRCRVFKSALHQTVLSFLRSRNYALELPI